MKFWYHPTLTWQARLLLPVSWVVRSLARRRLLQRKASDYGVPVMVVGNLSVGGTGKTPAIIAIVSHLQQQGLRCGLVSRGYGGKAPVYPYRVTDQSPVRFSGDEPLLLHQRLHCPTMVDANRDRAVRTLLAGASVDVIISDDGLQHYPMGRSLELVMIDGRRGLGNGCLLPAGPLREPLERLERVDWVVAKQQQPPGIAVDAVLSLNPQRPVNAQGNCLGNDRPIVVCAGIGDPQSVVQVLLDWGYEIAERVEPGDHKAVPEPLLQDTGRALVITEKDAVKLARPLPPHCYVLALQPSLPADLLTDITERIRRHSP
ncbi:MAG: tetraacyldisaccharide 4'-kinase [Saccharospirillum sp.]